MRRFVILCSALFCFSLAASAQDFTAAFESASTEAVPPAPAPPPAFIPPDRDPWQINAGFEYAHYNVLGEKFHDYTYQAGVTRYFTNRIGLEGVALAGFGHAGSNPSIDAKSIFLGGGPHVSVSNRARIEVWAHVIAGWERFRFTQSDVLGANSHAAFLAGGGVDYKIKERLFWRVQGDFLGTNLGGFNANYLFGTGLVLSF
jgi:hypothetical protein